MFIFWCVFRGAGLSVKAQSLLRSVSPFFPVTLLPFSTSFHPFLTHPLEDLFSFLFIQPAFPLHKWADLCIFESLFFLTWKQIYKVTTCIKTVLILLGPYDIHLKLSFPKKLRLLLLLPLHVWHDHTHVLLLTPQIWVPLTSCLA